MSRGAVRRHEFAHERVIHLADLKPTKSDRLLERIRVTLRAHRTWFVTLLTGILVGRLTNAVSDASVRTIADAIANSFSLDRSVNVVSWTTTALLIAVPICDYLLALHHRKRSYQSLLANLVTTRTDAIISPFTKGVIAWGPDLTLQSAPDLRYGWRLRDVAIRYTGDDFVMPSNRAVAYQRYFEENHEEKRFFDDGDKFMLIKNPVAFSDSKTLVLELRKTKYSKVQFYRDNVATIQTERDTLLNNAINNLTIEFPHSLCMHTVVVTKDEKILLTKRSPKVAYFAGAWSVSVEEQLSLDDFQGEGDGVMPKWGRRLLWEELTVSSDQCEEDNFRLLAVFLEADILNCSLAALARLDLTSEQLSNILKGNPRTDYEFTDWLFLSFSELGDELLKPSRQQHPSSGYRSLLALVKQWGVPRLAKALYGE